MEKIPKTPQLFFCKKCKVYFYSNSKLTHPTHTTCKTHKTLKADIKEIEMVEMFNQYWGIKNKMDGEI